MRTKYPRTLHLPWSQGRTDDDKAHKESNWDSAFVYRRVVVTEKMDGENTTIYADGYCHARSMDSAHHPSRAWVKAQVAPLMIGNLPEGWRVCGENLFARHSIAYAELPSYFLVFSIWDAENNCLSWDETVEWCSLLGLHHVPVIYDGEWDEKAIQEAYQARQASAFGPTIEGYVVRTANGFHFSDFSDFTGKYVRANHVQTTQHWMHAEVTPNKLDESGSDTPQSRV